MDKLKPCPFCGKQPKVKLSKRFFSQNYDEYIQNTIITCCATIEKTTREQAIKTWNTRQSLRLSEEAIVNCLNYSSMGVTERHRRAKLIIALQGDK